jgi:hypothetical protein
LGVGVGVGVERGLDLKLAQASGIAAFLHELQTTVQRAVPSLELHSSAVARTESVSAAGISVHIVFGSRSLCTAGSHPAFLSVALLSGDGGCAVGDG